MAEVARKEPPVLIENVNVIINVFNFGNGEVQQIQSSSQRQNGGFTRSGSGSGLSNSNVSVLHTPVSSSKDKQDVDESGKEQLEQEPLGWVALQNGDLAPFGVHSISTEIPVLGDPATWKEIRVCLPASLLSDIETDNLYCPVPACGEKLTRNRSMDSHIMKHVGVTIANPNTLLKLPCPLYYYCQDKKCQYNVVTAEKCFKAYKNVKQHYKKVHAPKLFECEMCQKTFSTVKDLDTHKLMCGEKYSCSTCNATYKSLEALQTHCRRKSHAYDHTKYKDKRNLVKQELQSKNPAPLPVPTANVPKGKPKGSRKLPVILPKVPTASSDVFKTIQAFCQQAGVKVDYGCQTVCTAILQKSNPVEAVVPPTSTHKKRKSTDTQTNIVKFRATCLDQRNNATNTKRDWKRVITSDSETQTAENSDTMDLRTPEEEVGKPVPFSDEFATIKISEAVSPMPTEPVEEKPALNETQNADDVVKLEGQDEEEISDALSPEPQANIINNIVENIQEPSTPKGQAGPSLLSEFISFLEAHDSATQTDPDMFAKLGGNCLGINVNLDDVCGNEKSTYVSVSSTASQTAVESVASKSLSSEDYEALLNTLDDKRIKDMQAFNDFHKSGDNGSDKADSNHPAARGENVDWEGIVEEVYRDGDLNGHNKSSL